MTRLWEYDLFLIDKVHIFLETLYINFYDSLY